MVARATSTSNLASSSQPSTTPQSAPTASTLSGEGGSFVQTLAFGVIGLVIAFVGVVLTYLQLRKKRGLDVSHTNVDTAELGKTKTEPTLLVASNSNTGSVDSEALDPQFARTDPPPNNELPSNLSSAEDSIQSDGPPEQRD